MGGVFPSDGAINAYGRYDRGGGNRKPIACGDMPQRVRVVIQKRLGLLLRQNQRRVTDPIHSPLNVGRQAVERLTADQMLPVFQPVQGIANLGEILPKQLILVEREFERLDGLHCFGLATANQEGKTAVAVQRAPKQCCSANGGLAASAWHRQGELSAIDKHSFDLFEATQLVLAPGQIEHAGKVRFAELPEIRFAGKATGPIDLLGAKSFGNVPRFGPELLLVLVDVIHTALGKPCGCLFTGVLRNSLLRHEL